MNLKQTINEQIAYQSECSQLLTEQNRMKKLLEKYEEKLKQQAEQMQTLLSENSKLKGELLNLTDEQVKLNNELTEKNEEQLKMIAEKEEELTERERKDKEKEEELKKTQTKLNVAIENLKYNRKKYYDNLNKEADEKARSYVAKIKHTAIMQETICTRILAMYSVIITGFLMLDHSQVIKAIPEFFRRTGRLYMVWLDELFIQAQKEIATWFAYIITTIFVIISLGGIVVIGLMIWQWFYFASFRYKNVSAKKFSSIGIACIGMCLSIFIVECCSVETMFLPVCLMINSGVLYIYHKLCL